MQVCFKSFFLSLFLHPPSIPQPTPKQNLKVHVKLTKKVHPPPGNDFYSPVKIMSTVVNFIFSVYCKKNMYS